MSNIIQDTNLYQLHYSWGKSTTYNIAPLFYPVKLIGYTEPLTEDETKILIEAFEPNGTIKHFEVPFSVIDKKEYFSKEFTKNLVLFNLKYVSHLQQYLMEECRMIQTNGSVEKLSKKLGWQNFNGVKDRKFVLESTKINNTTIKYYDNSLKFQKGNLKDQLDFIKNEILPYKETQLAMILGLSSVVAGFIEPELSIRNISY